MCSDEHKIIQTCHCHYIYIYIYIYIYTIHIYMQAYIKNEQGPLQLNDTVPSFVRAFVRGSIWVKTFREKERGSIA